MRGAEWVLWGRQKEGEEKKTWNGKLENGIHRAKQDRFSQTPTLDSRPEWKRGVLSIADRENPAVSLFLTLSAQSPLDGLWYGGGARSRYDVAVCTNC